MKYTLVFGLLALLCILYPGLSRGESPTRADVDSWGFPAGKKDPTSLETEEKILARNRDVVILDGNTFQGLFDGDETDSVSLYSFDPQGFQRIPFQMDPIGEDGLVVPQHINQVMEKGVYSFAPNPNRPNRLSDRCHLLFMARDTGPRYTGEDAPHGFTKALEIRTQDPLDVGRGWVYLMKTREPLQNPGNIHAADYVDYALVPHGSGRMEQIQGKGMIIGFPDTDKPYASGDWIVPKTAGGAGTDIMFTVRIRVKIRLLFFTFNLDPKDNVFPCVLGYNDGPIRVTRRVSSSVVFKGIKMDKLMGMAKVETESHYFGDFGFFDGEVKLPGFLKKISRINSVFTTDFTREATGMLWYNSINGTKQGCLVDGRMSPQEKHLRTDPYLWALLVGPQGGWVNVMRVHTESVRSHFNLAYLDDYTSRDRNEPEMKGAWGSTGFRLDRLDKAQEKVTWRSFLFAVPSCFQVSGMDGLVWMVFHPLEASVRRVWKEGNRDS